MAAGDVVLANYMVGLIAVACFLVCSFVFVVWNTYVCSKMNIYNDDFDDDDEEQYYKPTSGNIEKSHNYEYSIEVKDEKEESTGVVTTEL